LDTHVAHFYGDHTHGKIWTSWTFVRS